MGLMAMSTTCTTTLPLGGRLYGAEETVRGRDFSLSCQAAAFLGLKMRLEAMVTGAASSVSWFLVPVWRVRFSSVGCDGIISY